MIAFVILLGWFSLSTTLIRWTGRLPQVQLRLRIVDASGQPVRGVTLNTFLAGSQKRTDKWPLVECSASGGPVSDEDGTITVVAAYGGFGGKVRMLFWCIPIGNRGTSYDCEFSAPGYEIQRLDFWALAKNEQDWDSAPKVNDVYNGIIRELKVVEKKVVMERK